MKHYNNMARQAGMTLIELTVVLIVLVGLAGLLIPYVSGFVGKTHDATGSSNIQALSNAIVRFETEKGRYPRGMDSLINASGGGLINYTMADIMGMGGSASVNYGFTALSLAGITAATQSSDAAVCGSLLKAGITTSASMLDSSTANFNATFNNTSGSLAIGNPMMNTCAGTVVEVTDTFVADALSRDTDATKRYIAFGIGQDNELLGSTINEAPVHFAKNADMNASKAYNRFIAILEVDGDATHTPTSATRARYFGTVMAMNKLVGLQEELGNYYAEAAANN